MLKIKRLYSFMLQTFLPLFLMTFGICLFIVLMQFLWKYVDDMVGKGVGMDVLAEMFFYAALSMVPMALPLSILLASLMAFGNLGERLELLSMKAAGVSLGTIMKPIIIFLVFISIGAFFFQDKVLPYSNVKLYTLLISLKQTSPELDIPEKAFYKEITGYNVYVKQKDRKTGLLKDMMIYDYSQGFNNARVIVADSGRLKMSADKLYLILSLYNGESFENLKKQEGVRQKGASIPYRRETFSSRDILIQFDANFNRNSESMMQNQYVGKDISTLQHSIDSMTVRLDSIKRTNSEKLYRDSYRKVLANQYVQEERHTNPTPAVEKKEEKKKDTPPVVINFDSLYREQAPEQQATLLSIARGAAHRFEQNYFFEAITTGGDSDNIRRHLAEWHSRFTLPFSCLIFFFIGAPLGAIIRKGGLGMPVVISVFLFIFYYIISNIGRKMAIEGLWPAWQGMWLSTAVLTPMGIFLTYKAAVDSVIMNADTYLNAIKNLVGKRPGRKIERKEVIMFNPDYKVLQERLTSLLENCRVYLGSHKSWVNYFSYWKSGGKDHTAEKLAKELEEIIEELSNSDQILVLNKLMDYPYIGGYNPLNARLTGVPGLIAGLVFPIGLPVYLLAAYQRKLLRNDIKATIKATEDMLDIFKQSGLAGSSVK